MTDRGKFSAKLLDFFTWSRTSTSCRLTARFDNRVNFRNIAYHIDERLMQNGDLVRSLAISLANGSSFTSPSLFAKLLTIFQVRS